MVGRAARAGRAGRAPPDAGRRRRRGPAAARARARVRRARRASPPSWPSSSGAGACGPASRWRRAALALPQIAWMAHGSSTAGAPLRGLAPRVGPRHHEPAGGLDARRGGLPAAVAAGPRALGVARDPRRRRALPGAVRALVRGAERPAAVALDLGQREVPVLLVRRDGAARRRGARLGLAPRAAWGCRPPPSCCSGRSPRARSTPGGTPRGAACTSLFDRDAIAIADVIARTTPPRALVLHYPTFNAPVLLSGRRSLLGYPGHIWSQGLDASDRLARVQAVYAGSAHPASPARAARRTTCSTARRSASSR